MNQAAEYFEVVPNTSADFPLSFEAMVPPLGVVLNLGCCYSHYTLSHGMTQSTLEETSSTFESNPHTIGGNL